MVPHCLEVYSHCFPNYGFSRVGVALMKVGDLVKHQHGTLQGSGLVLDIRPVAGFAKILWASHGQSRIQEVSTLYLKVIHESR